MSLQSLAATWAEKLCRTANRDDPYQKALMAYAIEGYLAVGLGVLMLAAASLAAGVFWESMIAGATAAILKNFTGGAHVSTPTRCAVAGTVIFTGLGLLAKHWSLAGLFAPILWIILAVCNALIWLYAPVEAPGKPLAARQKEILAAISRLLIGLLSIFLLLWVDMPWRTAIFAGMTVQCLSLSKAVRRIVQTCDVRMNGLRPNDSAAR